MSRNRLPRPKTARIAAAAAVAAAALAASALHAATPSSWVSPVSGTWTNGILWTTSPDYPNNSTPAGVSYDAVIAATGAPYTVGLSTDVTVSSFTLNSADATLAQSGGTFDAGSVTLQAGTYSATGGTLRAASVAGPAGIGVGAGSFTLDLAATLSTNVNASAGSNLTLAGSWTNSGAISVTGGTLTLAGTPAASLGSISLTNSTLRVASFLTTAQVTSTTLNNSNIAIVGGGIVDNSASTIALSPANPTWTLAGGTLGGGSLTSSNGAKLLIAPGTTSALTGISVAGGFDIPATATLQMGSAVTNTGVITVASAATLNIVGSNITANLGAIQNNSGGRVVLAGALSNVSATLALTPTTGPWILTGTIGNGTITGSAPNNLIAIGGTLTGVTVAGDISVGDGITSAATLIASSVTSAPGGRLLVNAIPSSTNVGVNVRGVSPTYAGTGEVVFNGTGDTGFIRAETAGQSLTLAPGITVRTGTRSGVVGSAGTGVRNNGTLSAETAGRTLSVLGTFNNQGTVEARNGSTLQIAATPSNLSGTTLTGGSWAVYDASTLAFPGGAVVTTNAANVTLSGNTSTFSAINSLASNSGTLTVTGGRRFITAGNLANPGTVTVGASSTLKVVGTLNNTGKVDLAGGTLVLDYSGASPADTLRTQLAAGRAGGSWTGATGVTSSTAANDPQLRVGVGYIAAAALGVTTWAGVDVDATAVLTKLTYYGDATFDGRVNADDFARADRGRAMGLTGWFNGDFDYSGAVDAADYMLMDRVYVQQGGPLAPLLALRAAEFGESYTAQLLVALPEPSALLAGGALALPLLTRRRRS